MHGKGKGKDVYNVHIRESQFLHHPNKKPIALHCIDARGGESLNWSPVKNAFAPKGVMHTLV